MHQTTPEEWFVFWTGLILCLAALAAGILKLMWRWRKFRKEWQITSMKYRGIPVDIGCEHDDQPRHRRDRKEPHF